MKLKKMNKPENMHNRKPRIDASVRALFSLYKYNKGAFLFQDLLRVVGQIFISIIPIFTGLVASSAANKDSLLKYILFLIGCAVGHTIFWVAADVVWAKLTLKKIYLLREIAFNKAWERNYEEFVKTPSGKSAATVNRIYQNVENLYEGYAYTFTPVIISIPIYIVILLSTIWQNALIYLVFILLMVWLMRSQIGPMNKSRAVQADEETTEDARNFDSFSNFVNVISFRAIRKEKKAFQLGNQNLTKARVHSGMKVTKFWGSVSSCLRGGLWGIVLLYNYHLYDTGKISFQVFVISITVLIEFTGQFWSFVELIGFVLQNVTTYKANYNFLFKDVDIVDEYYKSLGSSDERNNEESLTFSESIEFNNLNFAYPDRDDTDVLKNINFTIRKGEKIGVVGKSGSGKSTLVKLLLGFYDFDNGAVTIDGKNVSKEEIALLNCYVPQDTTLFQQSVEFNIAYAKNSQVSHEEVVTAAKKAHAHEFISSLQFGYETLVGERGIKLSLGQRQRIALARAFLKDSQLLILDEATSSLDSKTESLVQESLEELWKNRTVLAVAHRLSTLNNVDRIIVMNEGEIVEQGSKAELLALNGTFAELWNHQANGMIIEDDEDEVEGLD